MRQRLGLFTADILARPASLLSDILIAFALVCGAFALRALLGLFGPQVLVFAVCFPALLAAGLIAGLRCGLFALGLSVLAFWWAFVPPEYSFRLERTVDVVNIVLFLCAGGTVVWIAQLYRSTLLHARMQERAVAETERRLELALSAGRGIGTWDWDVTQDRVYADARFARLYGVDPDKARDGAPIAEFFGSMHPDDVVRVRQRIDNALKTGDVFSEEYRLIRSNGEVAWVLAEGQCFLDKAGKPIRFPGVSFDITERKAADTRLQNLNTDLERQVIERSAERGTTWQVSPHLLSVIDMNDGRFTRVNPAWPLTLGWSEAELVGAAYVDFVHPDDIPASYEAFEEVKSGIAVLNFENRYRAKDGTYRWLSWVAVPDSGKLYSTSRDVTADKESASALKRAEDALRQSQKMEAVGQLTGGLAHDFNNLLMGISGNIQLLASRLKQGRTQDTDRFISSSLEGLKRAAALTHRLLAFSRRQTLDPKPTNINQLIAGMENLIRQTTGPSISVEVVGAGGLWSTRVDANQLENALLNLCINARDAMPGGGRLTIESANKWLDDRTARERELKPGQYVSLCVTDTGTGMTAEVIEHAFDPFFTTKPIGSGTGLGLSMIYGFVRQSAGQVRIYSEVGKGTTMCLYFPRDLESDTAVQPASPSGEIAPGLGENVLVIDDEATIRLLMVEVLEEQGYKTTAANDGPSGLEILRSSKTIDLLVTDVGLPGGMNGRQIADAARELRPNLKVLFVTGYAENAVFGNGYLGNGMQLIAKPFDIEAFANKVRELLDAD